ncbi:protein TolQ [Pseudidiomarina andamanensis]|uniref:Tol-Pal system protein TolQ n=1 Tax=Pseudidiomarina andamanensis TaxID=1940690 RepID=A0AA92EQC7_9GAMM|nr:protein TolQ [Pseudidiomarina andamanensis]MDS0217844.1 protein TolQ [Pseudidiomarina andamanensis]OZB06145.1 MAG: protein TolQ [Idiomarina sp. 34-48-12]QGT94744.1 protein TolQ [Pseudidiomarina andamanensis]
MQTELSITALILEASIVVQLVMLLLLAFSVVGWMMIFQRAKVIKTATQQALSFEDRFWSGVDLARLFQEVSARAQNASGMEKLFHAGFKEFARLRKNETLSQQQMLDASYRAMRVVHSRELDRLESNLSFLATIGSISPYVGLFGTVWGIMNAFIGLGAVQQATLAMVAPGIAEALIATAMGLFAAIPAVIAYNRFSYRVEKVDNQYVNFMDELMAILQRQGSQSKAGAAA